MTPASRVPREQAVKIVDVTTQAFIYKSKLYHDSDGHTHPGPESDASQTLLTVVTDEGAEGYAFGGRPEIVEHVKTARWATIPCTGSGSGSSSDAHSESAT